jgi:putative endonuclease
MYILKCSDGSFFVGSTISLQSRLLQHQQGKGSSYPSKRLPVELAYCEEYRNVAEAFAREKQVQNWSHLKREALIQGSFYILPELSKKRFTDKENGDK